ncbi:MAG: hypothetical protein QOH81_930 [Sphingomonadales bacterium]|jgi:hypothetical protein|nr:hypothetical protein [Sphingomonadales bacterium]
MDEFSRMVVKRAWPALLALALTAGCRQAAEDEPAVPPDQLANAIEQVRVEKKATPPPPPKRLGFLLPADLAQLSGEPLCTLRHSDRILLVAGTVRALARIDGRPVFLDVAGPMDATAAFFRAPGAKISIARHGIVAAAADAPGIAWPAGVTVGGLDNVEDQKLDARWSCRLRRGPGGTVRGKL